MTDFNEKPWHAGYCAARLPIAGRCNCYAIQREVTMGTTPSGPQSGLQLTPDAFREFYIGGLPAKIVRTTFTITCVPGEASMTTEICEPHYATREFHPSIASTSAAFKRLRSGALEYPFTCGLCGTSISSADDAGEWHGWGNCVELSDDVIALLEEEWKAGTALNERLRMGIDHARAGGDSTVFIQGGSARTVRSLPRGKAP